MTSAKLVDRLIARLVRNHGGPKQRWRKLVGPVRVYDSSTHTHCNWTIDPTGSHTEIQRIECLLDDLRMQHPLITDNR